MERIERRRLYLFRANKSLSLLRRLAIFIACVFIGAVFAILIGLLLNDSILLYLFMNLTLSPPTFFIPRLSDYPDSCYRWNSISSIGSAISLNRFVVWKCWASVGFEGGWGLKFGKTRRISRMVNSSSRISVWYRSTAIKIGAER